MAARSLDSEVVKLKSDGNFAAPDAGTLCTKPCVGIFFVDVSCGISAVRSRVPVLYLLLGVLFVCCTSYANVEFWRPYAGLLRFSRGST